MYDSSNLDGTQMMFSATITAPMQPRVEELLEALSTLPRPDATLRKLVTSTLQGSAVTSSALVSVTEAQQLTVMGQFGLSVALRNSIEQQSIWSANVISDCLRNRRESSAPHEEFLLAVRFRAPSEAKKIIGVKNPAAWTCFPIVVQGISHASLVVGFDAGELHTATLDLIRGVCKILALYTFLMHESGDLASIATTESTQTSIELTQRQEMVLALMNSGLTTKQIAGRLGYSASTIHQDIILTYKILGVHSRREALTSARKLGIL